MAHTISELDGGVTAPRGFRATGLHCGIKANGRHDLAHSLRDLWHLRAELYHVLALNHDQREAEQRLTQLNRHFPTRAPRSGFVPLLS